jgi:hypothetical protein
MLDMKNASFASGEGVSGMSANRRPTHACTALQSIRHILTQQQQQQPQT